MNVVACLEPRAPGPASIRALEAAVGLGAASGASVTAVSALADATAAPQQAVEGAGGARLVVLQDPVLANLAGRALGQTLAEVARHLKADLVLTGDASAEEGHGLVPAALAQAREATFITGVEAVRAAGEGAVMVTARLTGRRRSLRVQLPAVLAFLPGPSGATAAPGAVSVQTLTLAEVGVAAATLTRDPEPLGTAITIRRAPVAITSLEDVLRATLRR